MALTQLFPAAYAKTLTTLSRRALFKNWRRQTLPCVISALPLMNEDLEKDLPQPVKGLHRSIDEAHPATVTRTRI